MENEERPRTKNAEEQNEVINDQNGRDDFLDPTIDYLSERFDFIRDEKALIKIVTK